MKNDAAQQLVKQNNKYREQLSPENKAYYEDILLYMRTFGFFYEELETATFNDNIARYFRSTRT